MKHSCGNIGEFDQALENWEAYIEWMEQYFAANEVTSDAKKKVVLLNMCDPLTYSTICSLAAPDKPTALDYSALLKLTKKYYNPKPSVIIQRYEFNTRNQKADESISTYVAEFHKLTEFCEFGESIYKINLYRGYITCIIQHRLLAEKALTFAKAQEIAQAMELADKDVQSLQSNPHVPVHMLNDPPQ